MKIESQLAQIGSRAETVTGAVSYPIVQATAFRHPRLGQSTGFDYSRSATPTRKVLEEAAALLEQGMPDLPAVPAWRRCKRSSRCSARGITCWYRSICTGNVSLAGEGNVPFRRAVQLRRHQ